MALFGKKKKEEPVELGFGFPAAMKEKKDVGADLAPSEEVPKEREVMPAPTPEVPAPAAPPRPAPEAPRPEPAMAPEPAEAVTPRPAPVTPKPAPRAPVLEPKPIIPRAMPEEIPSPRAPEITTLRPHVFLKIDKYKEVMSNIDRISSQLKDLNRMLENLKDLEEKESLKVKDSEAILNELDSIAKRFDKIFTNPAK